MIEKQVARAAATCIAVLRASPVFRRATKYIASALVAKATRRLRPDRRARSEEFVVTVGRPNYREREFIKVAGWPKKRVA